MTKDEVLKLVQEAYEKGQSDLMEACQEASVRAIEFAVAAEREACANAADEHMQKCEGKSFGVGAAIRARGQA